MSNLLEGIKQLKLQRQKAVEHNIVVPDKEKEKLEDIDKIYFSEVLKQKFRFKNGKVCFEDGSFYTEKEINLISPLKPENLQTVHKIKAMFEGTITGAKK